MSNQLKTTPLTELHRSHNAKLVDFAGFSMPLQYQGIISEHQHTRNHAGLFDVSHMGQVTLQAKDYSIIADALNKITPTDFHAIANNRQKYSLLLNQQGGIVDDFMAYRLSSDNILYLVINAGCIEKDLDFLKNNLPSEITLEYHSSLGLIALQGPQAVSVLAQDNPAVAEMKFMQATEMDLFGCPCKITRSGYTGEDGFEISLSWDDTQQVATQLLNDKRVQFVGLGARDSLRLEAGLSLYGHELEEDITPIESSIKFAVSKKRVERKDAFNGSDLISEQYNNGTDRMICALQLDGKLPARQSAEIRVGEQPVGHVTSGSFSPTLGCPIALAMVTSACAKVGDTLDIVVRNKTISATVVALPFVPHRYHR